MSFSAQWTTDLSSSSIWKGVLLATVDVVPVFWRHGARRNSGPSEPSSSWARLTSLYVGVGGILLALDPNRHALILPIILRRLLSRPLSALWPKLLRSCIGKDDDDLPSWCQTLVDGGPLGPGCAKVIHSLLGVAIAKWCTHSTTTSTSLLKYCTLGSAWPDHPWLPAVVVGVSLAVNVVLYAWSTLRRSRGNHDGVNRMVESTVGRDLTVTERWHLFTWAAVNASAEEIAARGLQRAEFEALVFSDASAAASASSERFSSNLAQAAVFGMAHFHGIPSGWTGVGLTSVYGLIMGLIADAAGGGLLYAIVTHTVADYFIFAAIARRKDK